MIKKIVLSLATLFLIWQSYELLRNIDHLEGNSWGSILFISWLLNIYITGIFAFSGFAFPTHKLLPKAYYTIYQPQRLKQVYDALGVRAFRKMLLATVWRSQKLRNKHFNGKIEGINNLDEQSQKSEFGHLIPFVLLCFISGYLIAIGSVRLGMLTLLINVLGNLYPIILQRHHRMRIQALRDRQR